MNLKVISKVTDVEIISKGNSIRIKERLNKKYGIGKWRKLKGNAYVQVENGKPLYAEIHWYEANGIGKFEYKIKRILL